MLTPEQRLLRDGRLTASRISTLINGSKEELLALWQEMVGQVDEEEMVVGAAGHDLVSAPRHRRL